MSSLSLNTLGAAERVAPNFSRSNSTLVLGMGNPILGDDGVGVRVAEEVLALLPADAPVDVSEACVGGISLMERMLGYDNVILIDALSLESIEPGAIRKLKLDDLRAISSTQHSASTHDTNLLTALDAGKRMALPLPANITIIAIEANVILDFSETMTPAVAAAVPLAVDAVLLELKRLGVLV